MSIWFSNYNVAQLATQTKGNMVGYLGIEYTELGPDFLKGTMPVDERTRQPFGLMHGGASCVLAESLGSVAANLVVNPSTHYCLGLDINTNHLRSARKGLVTGIAKPIHIGKTTQVWEIKIYDDEEQLVSISRLTMIVMAHKKS